MKKSILMIPYPESGAAYVRNLAKELKKLDVKVLKPQMLNRFPSIFPLLKNVLALKIKVLHMHWIEGFAGLSAKNILFCFVKFILFLIDTAIVKYFFNVKIVWTIHNLYSHENLYPRIEKLSRTYFAFLSDSIICHCLYAKQLFQKEFGVSQDKIYVIKIGSYLKTYKNEISQDEARQKLDLNNSDFIFLAFGPIRPYKGILQLINNFNKLQNNNQIKLLIVGKSENIKYNKIIEKMKGDNQNIVIEPKFIPNDEIQIYINASDILVYSYKKILTSAGILLAMSYSKPIIAPNMGCIPETIDQKGAFIYNSKDIDGLFKAFLEALNNKDKLKKMGKYNYILAKNFEWNNIAKQNKKVYQKIL